MEKRKKIAMTLSTLGVFLILFGVSYSFFNYTRTGSNNVIKVGRISFNTNQQSTISLLNAFPIDKTNVRTDTDNTDDVVITITGDTTYNDGIEYLLIVTSLTNTVGNKSVPIDILVSPANIGDSDEDYFDNRGGTDPIYKVLNEGTISNNQKILVGYIPKGSTGINGGVTIRAYLDKDKIGISDTYPEEDIDSNNDNKTDYTNGTTSDWAKDRTILTTTEWNSLQANGVSFQVKVEANEGVWVEESADLKVKKAIIKKESDTNVQCSNITYKEDGIIYLSGSNDCVNMNYVWYSGKLWRITAIYPDGSMKLVTQNNITSIAFNASEQVNFYTDSNTTSYMYQWLNEDFYDTLYNANQFIDTTKRWNATMPSDTNVSTKPLETNMVTANVGLLNNYEFYNSYRCVGSSTCTGTSYGTGYLNIGYHWWLLNPYNASNVWNVNYFGNGSNHSPLYSYGSRPSIYLKSGLEFIGNGTKQSPYKIVGDKDTGTATELVNTRMSGEYVKLQNGNNEQLFRIIGVEDNKTKIIAMDYADNKATKKFATSTGTANTLWGSGTTTDTDTWYTYLNDNSTGYLKNLKDAYGELFDSGLYYLGTSGYNYKLGVCANTTSGNTKICDKTSNKGTFNIGLPRYGEMFATQQSGGQFNSIDMWLMNRYSLSSVWFVYSDGYGCYTYPTYAYRSRPTVHLKSSVKIISGTGTETDPYVVGL